MSAQRRPTEERKRKTARPHASLSPPPRTQANQKKLCPDLLSTAPQRQICARATKRAPASSLLHPSARSARVLPPAHSAPSPDARRLSPASAPGSTIDDQHRHWAMAVTTNRYSSPRPPLFFLPPARSRASLSLSLLAASPLSLSLPGLKTGAGRDGLWWLPPTPA
jgi:hypothetical protein